MDRPFGVGIIGTGSIARKMAHTVRDMPGVEFRAVASRRQETADAFASEWGAALAYGSYEAMMGDEGVDLVYIATPHPMHRENASMCIEHGKPVLCEKPFTVNAAEAREVLDLARQRGVFVAEAIWTRYLPLSQTIRELAYSGVIGTPRTVTANLGYPNSDKERLWRPELAGGALLDVGVYPINFAAMIFEDTPREITSTMTRLESGVDAQNSFTLTFGDTRIAVLSSSIVSRTDRQGIISGEGGHLIVENINNPESVTVVDADYRHVARYRQPAQITGFEYQVAAAMEAIRAGKIETHFMPHAETLRIMELMDGLRRQWGLKYPFE
jgi:predicted dehydrogenase